MSSSRGEEERWRGEKEGQWRAEAGKEQWRDGGGGGGGGGQHWREGGQEEGHWRGQEEGRREGQWRERSREETTRVGAGPTTATAAAPYNSSSSSWKSEPKAAAPSFSTYTPIWSAVPTR